jgi:hypothetical protein
VQCHRHLVTVVVKMRNSSWVMLMVVVVEIVWMVVAMLVMLTNRSRIGSMSAMVE